MNSLLSLGCDPKDQRSYISSELASFNFTEADFIRLEPIA
jgi:hypothetical protein